jgi:FlaA1/EpsC-like NDP-sugar epimerase
MKIIPKVRNRFLLASDLVLILVSILGSYVLRLELNTGFNTYLPSFYWMLGISLVVKPIVFYMFGMYRRMWEYASIQDVKLILAAVTTASIPVSLLIFSMWSFRSFDGFPRSIPFIDWVLSLILIGGSRLAVRILDESQKAAEKSNGQEHRTHRVLIVGAGDAGALVVREMQKNPQLTFLPVGFLDDDLTKQKQQLYGIPVVGVLADLPRVLDRMKVHEVVIAIPSASGQVVRLVADVCRQKSVPFRTMPGIYELLGGKVSVSRLREVDIADLLRREPARIRDQQVGETLSGRRVLVTGAGGSIGRELCRQISRWGPAELVLVGHGENSIFEALLELQEGFPELSFCPVIADIRDRNRIFAIFDQHRPQVVFHAAAHKHVPLMEMNVEDAVTNNIQGTRNVVDAAKEFSVDRLVMISTDKAIRPVNVMGATKRIAETIVLDAALSSGRCFSVVRFGNVLGSRGSVVPLFKNQIARGGPVKVTHPDMMRYFMTIPEAVYLVLQAATLGGGGETFVLNMGQQVRILDLAEDLIRLSGLEPGKDIEIVFTGIRPGEKLSEDLWEKDQPYKPTIHPDIFRVDCRQDVLCGTSLTEAIENLLRLAKDGNQPGLLQLLDELIPGSAVRANPPPAITSIDS